MKTLMQLKKSERSGVNYPRGIPMSEPTTIRGYHCQVCLSQFPSFKRFRLHEDGSGETCPGGEP